VISKARKGFLGSAAAAERDGQSAATAKAESKTRTCDDLGPMAKPCPKPVA